MLPQCPLPLHKTIQEKIFTYNVNVSFFLTCCTNLLILFLLF